MTTTCNNCDNYHPESRWCYTYGHEVRPGDETKIRKCRRWVKWKQPKPS